MLWIRIGEGEDSLATDTPARTFAEHDHVLIDAGVLGLDETLRDEGAGVGVDFRVVVHELGGHADGCLQEERVKVRSMRVDAVCGEGGWGEGDLRWRECCIVCTGLERWGRCAGDGG